MEDTYDKLKSNNRNNVDVLATWIQDARILENDQKSNENIEKAQKSNENIEKVQKSNENIQIVQKADINIDRVQKIEDDVTKYFEDVQDKTDVGFDKFLQILERIAKDTGKKMSDLFTKLEAKKTKIMNRVEDATDKLFNKY